MRLAIINGSPRGEQSNSKKITTWLLTHQEAYPELKVDEIFLFKYKQHEAYLEQVQSADAYLMVFPLYVDSMPAVTKLFMEAMAQNTAAFKDKPIYFIIHSGFPEMIQCLNLRDYTAYFSKTVMKMHHMGTLIMAGSEALQVAPDQYFGKKIILVADLLPTMIKKAPVDEALSRQLSQYVQMSRLQQLVFSLSPFKDFYWHMRLKKNKAKHLIKAQPYA